MFIKPIGVITAQYMSIKPSHSIPLNLYSKVCPLFLNKPGAGRKMAYLKGDGGGGGKDRGRRTTEASRHLIPGQGRRA